MNDLQRLLALEEIKQLKARYFRCVDTKDWEGFKAVFAPDIEFDTSDSADIAPAAEGSDHVLRTPEAVVEYARKGLTGVVSVHHGHCPEIEITSATTASGVWAMEDMLRWEDQAKSPIKSLHGYGHYIESYALIDGRWRIRTWKLKRLRVDIE